MASDFLFSKYVFIFIVAFLDPAFAYTCIHQKVFPKDVPISENSPQKFPVKRQLFVPLQIHVHFGDLSQSMNESVRQHIDVAFKSVLKYLSETIEVRQSSIPFLLQRLNCARKWKSGINKDKCSRLKSGPEFCSTKLTDYIIPDVYLDKLEVYNYNDTVPQEVLKHGKGLQDENFILFVISKSTSWCGESDVQAYGSYCRLNNENRPVAGLLNLCPLKFSKKLLKASHYFNVIMHEVIHILGFSQHLFSKFKRCDSIASDCETPKKISHRDSNGIQRLFFPEVVKSMQVHFNCSEPDFGAPLEPYERKSGISEDNQYTSHWHPHLMYTSIMTPSLTEDSYVVIDNITLALLYSTGWYKVNFNKSQKFLFGKGSGCSFGLEKNCEHSLSSNNDSSCDILEYSIGKCDNVVPYPPCITHDTKEEDNGFKDAKKNSALNMHLVDYKTHCTSIQDENNETDPICIVSKCQSMKNVKSPICSNKKVAENTSNCSSALSVCSLGKCHCNYNSNKVVSIQMSFNHSSPTVFNECNSITSQNQGCSNPIRYISILSADRNESTELCIPFDSSEQDLDVIIKETLTLLKCSYMLFSEDKSMKKLDPKVTLLTDTSERIDSLFIIFTLFGVIVAVTIVVSVLRFITKRHEITESVALKDIS
ncbi:hypothetical protein JTE90_012212 [Oedothorax gibbosus]|uniref:Leishmanolysin-like peptidase n=1 Tax=Oedothorax gibbosus TaxID=931172 RepID=A0AAV6TY48_9ARAC|nr:hypothetical protein JTE90_012212 [Oedothorax gibbosus]